MRHISRQRISPSFVGAIPEKAKAALRQRVSWHRYHRLHAVTTLQGALRMLSQSGPTTALIWFSIEYKCLGASQGAMHIVQRVSSADCLRVTVRSLHVQIPGSFTCYACLVPSNWTGIEDQNTNQIMHFWVILLHLVPRAPSTASIVPNTGTTTPRAPSTFHECQAGYRVRRCRAVLSPLGPGLAGPACIFCRVRFLASSLLTTPHSLPSLGVLTAWRAECAIDPLHFKDFCIFFPLIFLPPGFPRAYPPPPPCSTKQCPQGVRHSSKPDWH